MINSKFSKAFTLIELLVVILILIILFALLLPALNVVMENGRTTKCASNLRQIGTSMFLYAGEHDGYFPLSGGTVSWSAVDNGQDGTGKPSWMEQLSVYMNISTTIGGVTSNDPKQANGKSIFTCPSSSLVKTSDKYYSYFNGTHAAYAAQQALNQASNITTTPYAAMKQQSISFPTKHIMSGDITNWDDSLGLNDADKDDYTWSPNPFSTKATFHRGKVNILFYDGHVATLIWNANLATPGYFDKATMATHYTGTTTDDPNVTDYLSP